MRLRTLREVRSVAGDFDELFGPRADIDRPRVVSRSEQKKKKITLGLYRGFDVNMDELEERGDKLVLSPSKSEQGLIWFTHVLIRGYDPKTYVKGRGAYVLTYPLEVIKHFQELEWSDGTTSTMVPEEIMDRAEPTENCRFHMGIELPDGWVFSYKMEKFIGCSREILITPDMLTPDDQWLVE